MSNIKAVVLTILSVNQDRTVRETLKTIANEYGDSYELACAIGGAQNNNTIRERPIFEKTGIALFNGLGENSIEQQAAQKIIIIEKNTSCFWNKA